MKISAILNQFPPPLVRVFARRRSPQFGVVSLSDREIAIASGVLDLAQVIELKQRLSWDNVTIEQMQGFFNGCEFDPFDTAERNRLFAYLSSNGSKPVFQFAHAAPHFNQEIRPLLQHETPTGEVIKRCLEQLVNRRKQLKSA